MDSQTNSTMNGYDVEPDGAQALCEVAHVKAGAGVNWRYFKNESLQALNAKVYQLKNLLEEKTRELDLMYDERRNLESKSEAEKHALSKQIAQLQCDLHNSRDADRRCRIKMEDVQRSSDEKIAKMQSNIAELQMLMQQQKEFYISQDTSSSGNCGAGESVIEDQVPSSMTECCSDHGSKECAKVKKYKQMVKNMLKDIKRKNELLDECKKRGFIP